MRLSICVPINRARRSGLFPCCQQHCLFVFLGSSHPDNCEVISLVALSCVFLDAPWLLFTRCAVYFYGCFLFCESCVPSSHRTFFVHSLPPLDNLLS